MAFAKSISVILMLLMASCGVCFGVVYRVGDSNGWTNKANFNFENWASSKNFHVGDVILFEYESGKDNVSRVNHEDFRTCNVKNPIRVRATGHDSITIRNPHSHLFFISGVPGHCEAGQKVDIRVAPSDSQSNVSAPSPDSAPTANSLAPAPSPSAAAPSLLSSIQLYMATAVLAFFAF
ncbi:hypothetical protein L484_025072 [Morus notabilis]|uniref:Phytocyanin domain-containing protein n=1 Tax=Morus notabilis TaxID=981085 RepID=W9R732_9ROSA|nr:mavicyanin [Morus notabilis]EXB39376.1 hypothetical protein L484_025072 [Morus notabilis]